MNVALVAGATGLVGYAAMKHFGREAGTRGRCCAAT